MHNMVAKRIAQYYKQRREHILRLLARGYNAREVGEKFDLSAERIRQIAEDVRVRRKKH